MNIIGKYQYCVYDLNILQRAHKEKFKFVYNIDKKKQIYVLRYKFRYVNG